MQRHPSRASLRRIVAGVLTPMIFFVSGIDLLSILLQLMSAQGDVGARSLGSLSVAGNLTSKAIVLTRLLPASRRPDRSPLAFRAVLNGTGYYATILVLRLALHLAGAARSTGSPLARLFSHVDWHREAAVQIWLLCLCLLYAFCGQINRHFGEGLWREMLRSRRRPQLGAACETRPVPTEGPPLRPGRDPGDTPVATYP